MTYSVLSKSHFSIFLLTKRNCFQLDYTRRQGINTLGPKSGSHEYFFYQLIANQVKEKRLYFHRVNKKYYLTSLLSASNSATKKSFLSRDTKKIFKKQTVYDISVPERHKRLDGDMNHGHSDSTCIQTNVGLLQTITGLLRINILT